jgi:hypothetical protein
MKTLKPGPRPFIALSVICFLMFLLPLFLGIVKGKWEDAGKMAGCLLILPVLFFGPIVFFRIEVDDEEICLRNFGKIQKRVRFADINYSLSNTLAEKDWPVSLTSFGNEGEELMTLGLKVLRKEDVTWLIQLPQLKIQK